MIVPSDVCARLKAAALNFARNFGTQAARSPEALADRIWRATVLNYLPASSGLMWGLGPDFYGRSSAMGALLECYASPFNHSLPTFCSLCYPLDLVFGSLGSFHSKAVDRFLQENAFSTSLLVVAPPYIESE